MMRTHLKGKTVFRIISTKSMLIMRKVPSHPGSIRSLLWSLSNKHIAFKQTVKWRLIQTFDRSDTIIIDRRENMKQNLLHPINYKDHCYFFFLQNHINNNKQWKIKEIINLDNKPIYLSSLSHLLQHKNCSHFTNNLTNFFFFLLFSLHISRSIPFEFVCNTTTTEKETKIAHRIHKQSNIRIGKTFHLPEIFITSRSWWNRCFIRSIKCSGKTEEKFKNFNSSFQFSKK